MRRPDPISPRRLAAPQALLASAAALLLADGAQAQANACEQLKETLAARIDPSIRGFSLEIVPAATPVPAGAKVIGTCEGGARKVLFSRSSAAAAAARAAAVEPAPAPAPPPAVAVAPPAPASRPAPRPIEVVASMPVLSPPLREKVPEPAASAAVEPAPVVETAPAPVVAAPVVAAAEPRSFEFGSRYWHWFAAITALLAIGTLRAWWVRRTSYDEAGLPRGPKLN